MMTPWKTFVVLILVSSQLLNAETKTMYVSSQEQFDEAVERINKGEEMQLRLCKREYLLKKPIAAVAPIIIKGRKSIITSALCFESVNSYRITPTHLVYKLNSVVSPFSLFYDEKGQIVPVSESVIDSVHVNFIEGDIIAPAEYGVGVNIRIPIPTNLKNLSNKTFTNAFGYFDCGWRTVSFSLNRSDEKYFYCTTLTDCPTRNYQYDKKAYKKPVRFVIYNAEIGKDAIYYDRDCLYVPKDKKRIYYVNNADKEYQVPGITTSSDIILNGISFIGFGGLVVKSKSAASCEITNCNFRNTLGTTLTITKWKQGDYRGANISGCSFIDCALYDGSIVSLSSSYDGRSCITMSNCTLAHYHDGFVLYKNTKPSVSVNGDVSLLNNVLNNSCRGHLGLNRGRIVARGNMLYNSDVFNSYIDRNLSNDWGLIYCNHIFKETEAAMANADHHILLENNLLYGAYAYGGDARGIFIDDGRGDVACCGNIILNTQIYSIDARNTNLTQASSVRNRYENNIVSSNYRMAAGSAVTGRNVPTMSGNTLIKPQKQNVITNATTEVDDKILDVDASAVCDGNKIRVNSDVYKLIKRSSAWKSVRRFVRK